MFDWLEPSFMVRALLVVTLVFPLFGLLGSAVVAGKMIFFSDAIAHGAFVGTVLSFIFGFNSPQWVTTLLFSIVFSVIVSLVRFYTYSGSDAVIGVFSSITIALGLLLLSRQGNLVKYSHILVGDILTVSWHEIFKAVILGCLILFFWSWQANSNFLCQISESLARTYGVNPLFSNIIFMGTLAILVSFVVQWLGVFLLNALLVIPAATSRMIARGFFLYHILAILISFVSGVLGLVVSYYLDLNTSACIAIICGCFYLITLFFCGRKYSKKSCPAVYS